MASLVEQIESIGSGSARFAGDEVRVDGKAKVSGAAQYTADFALPGMLWAAFVASPHPHATIVSIDAQEAREMPGVHAVLTGADIGERYFGRRLCDWPVLAIDRVRFIGEYVVAIAADTAAIAQAAAATVTVAYEEREPLFDTELALTDTAPVLHEHPETYTFLAPKRPVWPHKNMQGRDELQVGDVAAGLAAADRVFEHAFSTPRFHPAYIEPRATLVWVDGGTIHVVSTNKAPFQLRQTMSACTGVPQEHIVIHPSFIGGDFGAKGLSIEEFPCYYLAKATGRPVKTVRAYVDDIRSTNVRHASRTRVRTGVMNDGTIVAQDVEILYDGGAFAAGKPIPTMLPGQLPKLPYRFANFRLGRTAVYTNTIPGCFVRNPGDIQIMFATESAMDLVAGEMDLDPLELRRRNAVIEGDHDIQGGLMLEPRARDVLSVLESESRWHEPLPPARGRGMAFTVRHIGIGTTTIQFIPRADGCIDVRTGTTEVGMGILTVLQRVIATEFGIPLERIRPARGATDLASLDPGVGASRTTHVSGNAALDACRQLRPLLEAAACSAAGLPEGSFTLRDGAFVSRDRAVVVNWDDALAAFVRINGDDFMITGNYSDESHGHTPEYNNFCAYAIEVTVDRDTGTFTIDDVLMVADVGTIINPIAHQGQLDGGFMMSIGTATMEELHVEDGRITNLSFADYKIPTIMDIPPFRTILIRETSGPGPFGARAAGELNLSGVAPAIANAVAQACGARIQTMPITSERIYDALREIA
jgi:CO/xanthine dehydrogenase Mo-binding subunit